MSVHPGLVETPIYDPYFAEFGVVGRIAHRFKRALWTSIEDGAKGALWAATARLEGEGGATGREKVMEKKKKEESQRSEEWRLLCTDWV